jgi:hypothetical protein
MRRASTCLAVAGLAAAFVLPAAASAAPTISVKAKAVPIPGFRGTGNFYGRGADVQAELTIKGTEYGGHPAPLIGVNFWLPKGSKINSKGFKTCTKEKLELEKLPKSCNRAKAGPEGHALGVVELGGERVPEEVKIDSYFTAGGLLFYVEGHNPVSLEFVSSGHWKHLHGGGGFGPELITEVPLVEPITGAADASTEKISVKSGAARRNGRKVISYGTVPKRGQCKKGGFKGKVEMVFAKIDALPARVPGETATANFTTPCPKH